MSETVDQMLLRGVAAAKSHAARDKEEAQFYLRRVLDDHRVKADQKVSAWLWLSQVEDEPQKKRDCLENVLAADPGNALAQRGLEILKKHLNHLEASHPHASNGAWRSFCPQCGGTLEFEVTHNQLTCQYCGYHRDPQLTLHHAAGEQGFLAALPTRRAQNWHLAVAQTLKCSGCSATFTLPKLQVSGECPFCGSLHVLETATETDLIEPDGILVFQIDETAARHAAEDWLEHHHSPEHNISTSRLHAVYLPYWTFDLGGEIVFGTHHHEDWFTSDEAVTRTRHSYPVYHDDLLVPATQTVPLDLLNEIGDFNTSILAPYSSEILAAWSAEVYQVSLAAASLIARQHAVTDAQRKVQFVPQYLDSTPLCVQSYKLALLPVWLGRYRYQDQIYRLTVNGQTGKTAGEEPPQLNGWRHQLDRIFGIA
jgi:DNA-directed RNA polymerase subunit RPC12/RpoP